MRCPKCQSSISRKDMIAPPLGWTSFVCSGCKTQVDVTRASQTVIQLAAGLAAVGVAWGLELLGFAGLPSIVGGGATLLLGSYLGLSSFGSLKVHTSEHPSVAP